MKNQYDALLKACQNGEADKFQQLFSSLSAEQKIEFLSYNDYEAYHQAMASGNLTLFEGITAAIIKSFATDMMDEEEVLIPAFEARQGEGFIQALERQHLAIVESMLFVLFLDYYCNEIINTKSKYIQFVLQHSNLKPAIPDLFKQACATDLDTVKRWVDILPNETLIEICNPKFSELNQEASRSCFYYVASPEILDFLWNNLSPVIQATIANNVFPGCLVYQVKKEEVAIIEKILSLLDEKQQSHCFKFEDYNCFVYAADRGSLDIIKLLWKTFSSEDKINALKASNYAAYRLASKANHIQIISFLESVAPAPILLEMQPAVSQPIK
ncbi:MAG: hypothetical protein BGO43_03800 [Gammaproteobacteria bacterium 39-13]|nr:hypothetical protein [Gammaproteobacteria bacterium]OJV96518.1 MAG: hypothetical protein BGO43_03800 [Gammaproteobacteria bacterium 39-13]